MPGYNTILDRYRKHLANKQISTLRGLYGGIRQTYADERRDAYLEQRRAMGQIGASASTLGLGQGYIDRKRMDYDAQLNKYSNKLDQAANSQFESAVRQQVAENKARARRARALAQQAAQQSAYDRQRERMRAQSAQRNFVNAITSDKATFKPSQVAEEPRYNRQLLDLLNEIDQQAGGNPNNYVPSVPKPSQLPRGMTDDPDGKAIYTPQNAPKYGKEYATEYDKHAGDKYGADIDGANAMIDAVNKGEFTTGDIASKLADAYNQQENMQTAYYEMGTIRANMISTWQEYERLSAIAGDFSMSDDARRRAAGEARRLAEDYNKYKQQYDALTAQYGQFSDIAGSYEQSIKDFNTYRYVLRKLGLDNFDISWMLNNDNQLPQGVTQEYREWLRQTGDMSDDRRAFDYNWMAQGNPLPGYDDYKIASAEELEANSSDKAKEFWEVINDPESYIYGSGKLKQSTIKWLQDNGYDWLLSAGVLNSSGMTAKNRINDEIQRFLDATKKYETEKNLYFLNETIADDENAEAAITAGAEKSQLADWLEVFLLMKQTRPTAQGFGKGARVYNADGTEATMDAALGRLGIKNLSASVGPSFIETLLNGELSREAKKKIKECFGIEPSKDLLNSAFFMNLTDEDVQAINYLIGKGMQDELEEYVYRRQTEINSMSAAEQADAISAAAPEGVKFAPEAAMLTASGAYGFFENIDNLFAKGKKPPSANAMLTGEVMQNQVERGWNKDWAEVYSGAFQSMGNMLPSIALGAVLGPEATALSASAESASGATAALLKGAGWLAENAGTISMGVAAGSQSKMEALREGKPLGQATVYGAIHGASETLLQKVMGGVANLGTGGLFKKLLKGNVNMISITWLRMLANLGLETMGEMSEEYAQEILEPIFRNIAFGERNNFKLYTPEAKNAALSALLSTVLMNGVGTVKDYGYQNAVSDVMKKAHIDAEQAEAFIEMEGKLLRGIENGEGITLTEDELQQYNNISSRIIAGDLNELIDSYKPNIKATSKAKDDSALYNWFKDQAEATQYEDGTEIPDAERAKNREAYMNLAEDYLEGKVSSYSDGPVQVVTVNGKTLDRSQMSAQEKILYSLTQKMATAFPNVKFVVHDTLPTANGLITGDGTVHIALDSVQKYDAAASYVLAHELTHALKKGDNAAWAEMRSKIEDYFKATEAGRVAIARAEATALRDAQRAAGRSESAREQANMTDEEKAALKDKLTTSDIYQDEYASVLAEQFFKDPVTLNDFLDSIIKDKEMDRTEKKGFIQKVKDLLEKAMNIFRKQGRKVPKDMRECLDVVKDKLSTLNEGEALDVRSAKRREADIKAREEARKERAKTPKKAQINLGETDNVEAAPTPMRQERGAETTLAQGNEGTLRYGPGNKQTIKFHYALVNVNDLVASHNINGDENAAYPSELQPRDRSRVASQRQVREIANDIIPEKLGQSGNVQDGAPIIGRDMIVESGNGRTIALQYAAQQGKLNGYTAWLKEHASEFGFNADDVQNGTVLVRVRDSAVDRAAFAKEANKSTTAVLNATERAQSDAKALAKVLNKYVFNENGDLNTAANSDFLSAFIRAAAGTNEANSLVTKNGTLSAEGMARIQNALFELAYHDQTLTEQFSEGDESPLRNVIRAMMNVAPVAAQISEGIKAGDFYGVDFAEDIVEAEKFLKDLKQNPKYENETRKAAEHYELYPGTMLGAVPDYLKKLEIAMDENIRSGRNLSYLLNRVLEGVKNMGDPNQTDMFGGMYDLSTEDAVNAQKEKIVGRAIKATEEWKAQRAEEAKRYSSRETAPQEKAEHIRKAVNHFGTTHNWKEAGYLTSDGQVLDFSGRHDGAPGGYRTVDHRDIKDALGLDYGGEGYSDAMIQFMGEGNIRLMPEVGGINLQTEPTDRQYLELRRYIMWALRHEGVMLDFDDANGDTVRSEEYDYGTSITKNAETAAEIIETIRDFYKKGARPQSEVARFHTQSRYSSRDSSYMPLAEKYRDGTATNAEVYGIEHEVRTAAKEWGAATNERGRVIDLYHGTPSFGWTKYDMNRPSKSKGLIFASTAPEVGANYGGHNAYAGTRAAGIKYVKNATNVEDIVNNAASFYGEGRRVYHKMTEAERKEAIAFNEKKLIEFADAIEAIPEKETGALMQWDDDDYTYSNLLSIVSDIAWTVKYRDDFDGDNDGFIDALRWDNERFHDAYQKLRGYIYDHIDEARKVAPNATKLFYDSYVAADAGIIGQLLERLLTEKELLTNAENSTAIRPLDLQEDMDKEGDVGRYHLYGNLGDNPYTLNTTRDNGLPGIWDYLQAPEIMGDNKYYDADDIAHKAKELGYTSLVLKNVYDGGISADDYVFFSPSQIKSADPVTYDDNGDIIPLSERFNEKNEDIRYSKRIKAEEKRDAGEKLTESQFYSVYAAHKLDLRGKGNIEAQIKNIKEEGFKGYGGFGNNIMPTRQFTSYPTIDKYNILLELENKGVFESGYAEKYKAELGDEYGKPVPSNLSEKAYGPRKGEWIMFVPRSGIEHYARGAERVLPGYKPAFDYEFVQADYDFQPYYEMYSKAYDEYAKSANSRHSLRADSDIALWNPPDVDTRGIYEAVKNGSGKVDGRFDVTVDTGNNGFNVTIKDTQTGETYKDGATVEAGENAEAFAERYTAAMIRNIKSGRPESTSRSTAGIYIKKGENPVRDVNIPVFDVNGDKVRRFMRTVEESGAIPDDMVDDIKKDIMAGGESYKPISNKSALAYADGLMQHQLTAQNEWNKVKDSYKIPKPGDIALGERLLKAAAQAGNTQDALKFAAELSDMLTRAGQAIQAARLLKQMGSAAEVYYITRAVSRINADLAKTAQAYNVELNEDLVQKLVEAQTDEDRDKAKEEILKDIARQIKPTLSEKLNSWRYLAMLFNFRTHVRNFIGNAAMMPAANIRYLLASSLEAATVHRENRTKTLNVGKEYKTFAEDDWKSTASKAVKSRGNKYQDLRNEIDEYRKIFKGPLEVLRKFNGRALETEDMLYKQAYYRKALAGYLAARKVDIKALKAALAAEKSGKAIIKGSQEERLIEQYVRAQAYAINEANVFTYNDANRLASVISEASRTLRNGGGIGKAGHLLIEGILPFKNTPANILGRAIDFSPLGYIRTASSAISKAIKHEYSSTEFIDNLSRNMVGTMVMAIGFALGKAGLLTGALGYDDDDKDKKRTGHQSYALEVGNTSITLDWLAPMSIPLFAGVELYNVLQEAKVSDENMWRALKAAVTGSLEPLINLSMLEGVQGAFETVKYSETPLIDLAATLGTNYLTQYIPTLSGQFARSIDPYQRRKYTGKANFLTPIIDSFVQNVLKKIPGANRLLQPYVNEWGEKESNFDKRGPAALTDGRFWLNALENFISPSYINTIKETAPDGEIARLLDSLGEEALKAIPSATNKSITYDGTKYNLTAEEYTAYAEMRGQTSYALVQSMIGTDAYNRLTDAEKVEAMVNAYKYADAVAKSAYLEAKLGKEVPLTEWYAKATEYAKLPGSKPSDIADYIMLKGILGNDDFTYGSDPEAKPNAMKFNYIMDSPSLNNWQKMYLISAYQIKKNYYANLRTAARSGYDVNKCMKVAQYAYGESGSGMKERIIEYAMSLGMNRTQAEQMYEWFK